MYTISILSVTCLRPLLAGVHYQSDSPQHERCMISKKGRAALAVTRQSSAVRKSFRLFFANYGSYHILIYAPYCLAMLVHL